MLIIVGFIIVTLSVIGGYLGSHGKLGALWQPFELVIIGGAALGAFMASNPTKVVKSTIAATLSVFKGAKYKSSDYLDVLTLIHEMLNKARGLVCHKPEGAFYVYPNIAGCLGRTSAGGRKIETDLDFVLALLEEHHVAAVHGAAYGMSPYVRISYATDTESLREACGRIQAFCAGLT